MRRNRKTPHAKTPILADGTHDFLASWAWSFAGTLENYSGDMKRGEETNCMGIENFLMTFNLTKLHSFGYPCAFVFVVMAAYKLLHLCLRLRFLILT